jgi:hypothetical protein
MDGGRHWTDCAECQNTREENDEATSLKDEANPLGLKDSIKMAGLAKEREIVNSASNRWYSAHRDGASVEGGTIAE